MRLAEWGPEVTLVVTEILVIILLAEVALPEDDHRFSDLKSWVLSLLLLSLLFSSESFPNVTFILLEQLLIYFLGTKVLLVRMIDLRLLLPIGSLGIFEIFFILLFRRHKFVQLLKLPVHLLDDGYIFSV